MPQRITMTSAEVERLFCVKIADTPPPLQVEAIDRPPLAAVAPGPRLAIRSPRRRHRCRR